MFSLYSLKRNVLYTNCSSALMSSLFSEDCALHDKPANPSRAFRYQHDFPRRMPRVAERIAGGQHPEGQHEVQEHEAPGSCSGGRLPCRPTSFTPASANFFAKILDKTALCVYLYEKTAGRHVNCVHVDNSECYADNRCRMAPVSAQAS